MVSEPQNEEHEPVEDVRLEKAPSPERQDTHEESTSDGDSGEHEWEENEPMTLGDTDEDDPPDYKDPAIEPLLVSPSRPPKR